MPVANSEQPFNLVGGIISGAVVSLVFGLGTMGLLSFSNLKSPVDIIAGGDVYEKDLLTVTNDDGTKEKVHRRALIAPKVIKAQKDALDKVNVADAMKNLKVSAPTASAVAVPESFLPKAGPVVMEKPAPKPKPKPKAAPKGKGKSEGAKGKGKGKGKKQTQPKSDKKKDPTQAQPVGDNPN